MVESERETVTYVAPGDALVDTRQRYDVFVYSLRGLRLDDGLGGREG